MDEYIKKETVLSIYKKWIPQLESEEDEGDRRGVETCIAVLEDLPAADVAPVVHGRWLDTGYFSVNKSPIYLCSSCRKEVYDYYIKEHKFCLHCGARMDGDG